jgi:putative transposase
VLCAWWITEEGRKVLLHLAPGTKEDTPSCTAFFEDLKRRGLPDPLLAVTDGAPGLIRAVETCFPRAVRQRCLVHYADVRIMPILLTQAYREAALALKGSA